MRDGDLVAAVVEGDPAALAAAYDQFAPALYGYCRSLLSEPADAAGAVRDTFVVAEVKLPLLRDPSRLRPWLYAVARNECRRRLHGDGAAVPLTDDEFGAGEATADLGLALEQAQQREMVSSALAGLDPGDREIVELSLRHEFYGADLADALGVPRNQAQALTTRARTRFEAALGALMVARSSLGSCQELSWILGDWDGELTGPLRKQVRRHISTCEICGEHRRRQVNPMALLSVLPEPVLPESLQHEALSLLADTSPGAAQERAEIAERAEPFAAVRLPGAAGPAGGAPRTRRVRARRRGTGRGVRDVRRRGHARGEHPAPRVAPGQLRGRVSRPVRAGGARGEHAGAVAVRAQEGAQQAWGDRTGHRHRVLRHRDREAWDVVQAGQPPLLGHAFEVQADAAAHQFLAVPDPDGHVIVAIAYGHIIELALSDERHQFRRDPRDDHRPAVGRAVVPSGLSLRLGSPDPRPRGASPGGSRDDW